MARRSKGSSSSSTSRRQPTTAALVLAAVPLLVGAALAVTAVVSSGASPVGGWFRSMFHGQSRTRAMRERLVRYARGEQPFSSLRDAIVGSAKGAVVTVFGPPRTAILAPRTSRMSIWRADTWYYPFDRADRSAIAIRFEGGVARDVERISVPAAMID